MTDAEKKPCYATEPAEKDTAPSCCRHKDRTPEEYRALANRLSRIEGQVRGIHTMPVSYTHLTLPTTSRV